MSDDYKTGETHVNQGGGSWNLAPGSSAHVGAVHTETARATQASDAGWASWHAAQRSSGNTTSGTSYGGGGSGVGWGIIATAALAAIAIFSKDSKPAYNPPHPQSPSAEELFNGPRSHPINTEPVTPSYVGKIVHANQIVNLSEIPSGIRQRTATKASWNIPACTDVNILGFDAGEYRVSTTIYGTKVEGWVSPEPFDTDQSASCIATDNQEPSYTPTNTRPTRAVRSHHPKHTSGPAVGE